MLSDKTVSEKYHFCDEIPSNNISINKDNGYDIWILNATKYPELGGECVDFKIPINICPFCGEALKKLYETKEE